jgi:hypothetical protein
VADETWFPPDPGAEQASVATRCHFEQLAEFRVQSVGDKTDCLIEERLKLAPCEREP